MYKKFLAKTIVASLVIATTFSEVNVKAYEKVLNDFNKNYVDSYYESDYKTKKVAEKIVNNNVKEVYNWDELKNTIETVQNEETIVIKDDIIKNSNSTVITIPNRKKITLVASKEDGSGIKITRPSRSEVGEFIVNDGGELNIQGDLTIEADKYDLNDNSAGTLTYANFIKVNSGGKLKIDGKITANTNSNYLNGKHGNFGLILSEGIIQTTNNTKISGWGTWVSGITSEQVAIVLKGSQAELIMNGGEISENYTSNNNTDKIAGIAVQVRDGAKFTMNAGSIINNKNISNEGSGMYGAGVFVRGNGSKFIMNQGEIYGNEGRRGAGVYIEGDSLNEKAVLEINGGTINNNIKKSTGNSDDCGGGIFAKNSNVNINNASIIENGSENIVDNIYSANEISGGGIYLEKSDAVIKNTNISENKTDGNNGKGGAGICINTSNVIIEDTNINNNKAGDKGLQKGAGVLILDDSNVQIKNSQIDENIVSINGRADWWQTGLGGGIFVSGDKANIVIDGCSISNNKAGENPVDNFSNGGGILLEEGNISLEGNTVIEGNKIQGKVNTFGEGIAINKDDNKKANINIREGVIIKDNDVWLGNNRILNVKGKLNKINSENKVSITSQEKNIEDENRDGTKLVEYSNEAGGEKEALKATYGKYFVPSKYMEESLKIGQSKNRKEILTYVKELPSNEAPIIKAEDKEIFVGDKFDPLKDVTATDKEDGDIVLNKDNIVENTVDINKAGKYKVTYSVTDSMGETTILTITITVKPKNTDGSGGGGTIVTPPNKPIDPERIEGDDRIETSVETSKDLYPNGTNSVVLANAERYTDVLTADPFAIQEKASALLTYKYEIPEKTLKEIERLGAKEIYISGGYEAVSKKVVDELLAKGYEIFRFDGVDRYDTARKIAIKIREKGNKNEAELVSGEDFPDALCMTSLAAKDHAPILLTKKNSIPKYTKQALAEWDIENIKIGGLDKAVSPEVEKQLKVGFEIEKNNKKDSNVYDGAKAIKRIGGEDRYETSAKLAKESYPESKLGVYATGEDFPDALIAGNYAGTKEAPVLLVKGNDLPEPIEKYTKESKIKKSTIIGGVNAVSDKVFNLIKEAINRKNK